MSDREKIRGEEMEFEVMPDAASAQKIFSGDTAPKVSKARFGIILGGILAVLALGAGGYFAYAKFFKKTTREIPVPDITVPRLADNLDADKDGLTELEEGRLATSPTKPDTDGDGLADGDEVNIYGSDPLLYDTEGDTFDDGREAARGFSPLVKSEQKATPEEFKKWTDAIAKYGLHQPTPTTLQLKVETGSDQKAVYVSDNYGYTLEIPGLFATRESSDGRNVGIYVDGTSPDDPDVTSDPIFVTAAVKVPGQTLQQWVDSQYMNSKDYQEFQNIEVNSLPGIKLLEMPGEDGCNADRTFFAKSPSVEQTLVIILTWRCDHITPFGEYFDQIIRSFRFPGKQ